MPVLSSNSTLTLNSPEKLVGIASIIGIYPILECILANSHRQSIINLANTCRTVRTILTTMVGPLCKPFPRCTRNRTVCIHCQIPVCADCQEQTSRLQRPAEVASSSDVIYCLVYEGSPASRDLVSRFLLEESQHGYYTIITQFLIYQTVCALCFAKHQPHLRTEMSPQRRELIGYFGARLEYMWNRESPGGNRRRLAVIPLAWKNLDPIRNGPCYCTGLNIECNNNPHFMRIEYVPLESELVAWVRFQDSEMPMYVLDETRE
ncbi:hypothetical protein L211DRAFT_840835 [Terfezia boudieri ATCC MYA-4762]|uniref:Uncharacterized protein n=1 Tax=Terfezia boudieri ATCC MYA-4762 TaxID=1051890 RepID=A0A3N4LIF1_9PEZI|nr:hypothetical protein L211DRAFT_840835 [Terfezia boudieri ATCC MYA-4762]